MNKRFPTVSANTVCVSDGREPVSLPEKEISAIRLLTKVERERIDCSNFLACKPIYGVFDELGDLCTIGLNKQVMCAALEEAGYKLFEVDQLM